METSKTLTGEQSSDLTLFAVDTHANHSPQQAKEKEQTTHDTSGLGLEMPLAHYDQPTQSWRTSEDISLWGDYKLLESLPKSGMTQSGVLYPQPVWVRPIDETELLLWPTPTAHPDNSNLKGKFKNPTLGDAVRMWPTARASAAMADSGDAIIRNLKSKGYKSKLEQATQIWPTPTASDHRRRGPNSKQQSLPEVIATITNTWQPGSGKLNPMWVEWLMGFPIGWTDLED